MDVLFPDPPSGYRPPTCKSHGNAKDRFQHEDAFCVMAKGTMAKVSHEAFRLVKPVVQRLVIPNDASPYTNATKGMMVGMCHERYSLMIIFVIVLFVLIVETPCKFLAYFATGCI